MKLLTVNSFSPVIPSKTQLLRKKHKKGQSHKILLTLKAVT